jgi:membrane-associated protein
MSTIIDLFLHLDTHLAATIAMYGALTYAILFAIIFCETGLVVTPFLPGDSLIFAAGALGVSGGLSIGWLFVILSVAAITGNIVNYAFGKWLGEKIFTDHARILKKDYLMKTHAFYEKYGAKAIVLSRFTPIIRTIAPFVAGAGTMKQSTFHVYNIIGGLAWVGLMLLSGYFFGGIEIVQKHFTLVVLAIVALSLVPPVIEWLRSRKKA